MTAPRGLTLLEVMVVTVLMAMVATVTMVSLGAADQASQMMGLVAQMKEFDIRGRIVAETSGHSSAIVAESNRVMLVSGETGAIVSQITLPPGVSLRIEIDHVATRQIEFDRFGRSEDYTVTIVGEDRVARFSVCGLTGSIRQAEDSS